MYQALYRKYRPLTFDNLLSQEHIVQTLKNQIVSGDISHAYLFSGTRGTGKTSAAKIFSRAVNCLNPVDGNPCNECENCLSILNDSAMDVVEMDAASNNSVDDIRDLKERVVYPPTVMKYKVYIIDEVHMLSKGAFNALLKILEEPPEHLIFILATTEPQKLPQTIISRLQRFYFKRILSKDIISNMNDIAEIEGIKVEDKVFQLIAQNSDGAMRDALSLFDQLISYQYETITYDMAINMLGIANSDMLFQLVEDIGEKSISTAIKKLDEIIQLGKDIEQLIIDLTEHYRNLMIAKSVSDNDDEIIEFDYDRYREQAEKYSLNDILEIIEIFNAAQTSAKYSTQPRVIMEMAVVNACKANGHDLQSRVEALEEKLKSIASGAVVASVNRDPMPAAKSVSQPVERKAVPTATPNKQTPKNLEPEEKALEYGSESISFDRIKADWATILELIKAQPKKSIHALIIESRLVDVKDNVLTLGYGEKYTFHKNAIENPENTGIIERVLSDYYNSKMELRVTIVNESDDEAEGDIKKMQALFGEDRVEIF